MSFHLHSFAMDVSCGLCNRRRRGVEWNGRIPNDPEEVEDQIHELEAIQSELRADDSLVVRIIQTAADFCPMCEQLMDGIVDETDEEELDTRITLQVAYLEDQIDTWSAKGI